jgi:hypothetical protein
VVADAGPASGFGLWVRLRHGDGTITLYGHIDSYAVSVGQRVSAGEQIARMGNRGQSSGPHLHIEVQTPAGRVDPVAWLSERGVPICPVPVDARMRLATGSTAGAAGLLAPVPPAHRRGHLVPTVGDAGPRTCPRGWNASEHGENHTEDEDDDGQDCDHRPSEARAALDAAEGEQQLATKGVGGQT